MQSMQLTKEQLQDKIFELEMELKELQSNHFVLTNTWLKDMSQEQITNLELEIQETMCYISYYKAELQDLEVLKYE